MNPLPSVFGFLFLWFLYDYYRRCSGTFVSITYVSPLICTAAPTTRAAYVAGVHIANRVKYFRFKAAVPSPAVTSLEAMMCRGFRPLTLRLDGFARIENPAVVAPFAAPARVA